MAVQSPPYALQNASHSAALFRQAISSTLFVGGVCGATELAVTAQSTPNMSVQIAAGRVWISGTQVSAPTGFTFTTQGRYFALNDAPASVTIATADPTNPRIDVIYVAVQDAFYSGAGNQVVLGVVTGTPAPSPTVPALPANALSLAQVAVAANATQIVSANLASTRFSAGAPPLAYNCTSTTHPTGVWTGFIAYETDTGNQIIWTGTAWAVIGGGANTYSTRQRVWTFSRTSDLVGFATGSQVPVLTGAISSAPAGDYAIFSRQEISNTAAGAVAGFQHCDANGTSISASGSEPRADIIVGGNARHTFFQSGGYKHTGGTLTVTSSYDATGGSPTAWGAGTELTVVYLGPH